MLCVVVASGKRETGRVAGAESQGNRTFGKRCRTHRMLQSCSRAARLASYRRATLKKTFQVFLALFGVTAIVIAALHVAVGPAAIPGSIPVNATMDSEDRFYATLFAAYGVALLWCIKDVERKSAVVYFLAITFFVGGLARLVSMAAVGLPDPFFIAMTALELLIPLFMAFMQFQIAKAANGKRMAAADAA